jgi:hypothetical protein
MVVGPRHARDSGNHGLNPIIAGTPEGEILGTDALFDILTNSSIFVIFLNAKETTN